MVLADVLVCLLPFLASVLVLVDVLVPLPPFLAPVLVLVDVFVCLLPFLSPVLVLVDVLVCLLPSFAPVLVLPDVLVFLAFLNTVLVMTEVWKVLGLPVAAFEMGTSTNLWCSEPSATIAGPSVAMAASRGCLADGATETDVVMSTGFPSKQSSKQRSKTGPLST